MNRRLYGGLPRIFVVATLVLLLGGSGGSGETEVRTVDELARLDRLLAGGQPELAAETARSLLESATLAERHVWQVRERLGVALLALDQPAVAVKELEAAMLDAGSDPTLHFNLGRALRRLGQRGRAVAEYAEAVALAPHRFEWRLEYADAMQELGIRRESLQQIRLARASCGDCPDALRAEVNHHRTIGDPASSLEPLRDLYALQPVPEVRRLLVDAIWVSGDASGVATLLDSLPAASLTGPEIMILAQANRLAADARRATAWVRQSPPETADGWRPDAVFWAIVSETCLQAGEPADALTAIDRAVALQADVAIYHHNRAAILVRLGRTAEAEAALAEARRLDPDLGETP